MEKIVKLLDCYLMGIWSFWGNSFRENLASFEKGQKFLEPPLKKAKNFLEPPLKKEVAWIRVSEGRSEDLLLGSQ